MGLFGGIRDFLFGESPDPVTLDQGGYDDLMSQIYSPDAAAWDYGYGIDPLYQDMIASARREYDPLRARQLRESEAWLDIAEGRQPSIAEMVSRQQIEQARRSILSQLASQRGGYSGASQRAAMNAMGGAAAQIGQNATTAAEAERRAARQGYLNALQGIAGQDIAQRQSEQSIYQQGLQDKQFLSGLGIDYQKMLADRSMNTARAALGLAGDAETRARQDENANLAFVTELIKQVQGQAGGGGAPGSVGA